MIVREHNRTWRDADYSASKPWPEDCVVQWGRRGLVVNRKGPPHSYRTAFFEAFPDDKFFRGEGENLETAEDACFVKYERFLSCPGHEYSRRGYTNGGGFCRHCGDFAVAFKPIVELGTWRQPMPAFAQAIADEHAPRGSYPRKAFLRIKYFGTTGATL